MFASLPTLLAYSIEKRIIIHTTIYFRIYGNFLRLHRFSMILFLLNSYVNFFVMNFILIRKLVVILIINNTRNFPPYFLTRVVYFKEQINIEK